MASQVARTGRSSRQALGSIPTEENVQTAKTAKAPMKKAAAQKTGEAAEIDISALTAKLQEVKIENEQKEALLRDQQSKLDETQAMLAAMEAEKAKLHEQLKKLQKGKRFEPQLDMLDSRQADAEKNDPRKPKQPLSVYMLWCNQARGPVAEANPSASFADMAKLLAEKWKSVSEEEKHPFEEQHNAEMAIYTPLKKEYDELIKQEREELKLVSKMHEEKKKEMAMDLFHQYEAYLKETKESGDGKKKERDPNKPKAPLSAFFAFSNHRRAQLAVEGKQMKLTEVTKMLGEEWGKLSEKKKAPFEKIARADKDRYEKAMEVYNEQKKQEEEAAKSKRTAKHQEDLKVALEAKAKEERERVKLQKMKQLAEERMDDVKKAREEAKKATEESKLEAKKAKEERKAAKEAKPKRPLTGFQLFGAEIRQQLKEQHPQASFGEISVAVASKWKEVGLAEQKLWNDKAAPTLAKYKQAMAQYKLEHPDAMSCADTASVAGSIANLNDVAHAPDF